MRASVDRQLRLRGIELDAQEAELAAFRRELEEREARLREDEADLARRRQELGAVELRREALEKRERALVAREEALAAAEDATQQPEADEVGLFFLPGAAYRLLETDARRLAAGDSVEVEGAPYVVARVGPSPLPADGRRCAYLEGGVGAPSPDDGSS